MTSYEELTDFNNLYKAHLSCRRGKRWKDSVAIYDVRALECTKALQQILKDGKYKLSPYNCFTISERGKKRDIKSIKYHDRVVQKCLMDNILTPKIEPMFVNTNSASQKNKGTDYAIYMLKRHMRECVNKYGDGYILICDMHHYFDSIPHDYLNNYYEKIIDDERVLNLIKDIHASIPGGRGVPLGNQLSQLDALIMLSEMDHYIKEYLHIKWYGRYNDDFYLIDSDKEKLKTCRKWIESYVEELGMETNKKKTKIVKLGQGIDFLGFHLYASNTGKIVQKLSKKSIKHHKHKLKKMRKLLDKGEIEFQACKDAHAGWKAHAQRNHGRKGGGKAERATPDTYYLVRKMDNLFKQLFADYLKEDNNGKVIKPAPGRSTSEGHENKILQHTNYFPCSGA